MIGALGYSGIWSGPSGGGATPQELDLLYLTGCETARTAVNIVTIDPGECRSDDDTEDIVVTSQLTLNVATTGANGRNSDTAEQSDKWYAICVIKNVTTSAVAGFLINEDDIGAFTYPAGYTKKRIINWIRNDSGSDFYDGKFYGNDNFRYFAYEETLNTTQVLNSGSSTSFANVDCSEFVPPDSELVYLHAKYKGDGLVADIAYIRRDGSSISTPIAHLYSDIEWVQSIYRQACSTSQIIEYQVSDIGSDLYLYIMGFEIWV